MPYSEADFIGDYAELRIYARDGVTYLGTVAGTGLGFTDPFGDEPGEAAFTVSLAEPLLAANPDILRDAIAKVAMPQERGGPLVEVWAFLTYPSGGTVIGDREDADKTKTVVGRGLLHLFSDWTIKHEKYREKISEDRYYGWMSGWYPPTPERGWIPPLGVRWDADTTARAGYPAEFENLDPAAQWIGAASPLSTQPANSVHCLRNDDSTLVLTQRSSVRLHYTADNFLTLWLNGELIDTLRTNTYNWRGFQYFDAILDPGEYTIAARVENTALTAGGNQMGFLCSVWTLDGFGQPQTFLLRSDVSNWKAYNATTDGEPGVAPGEIMQHVLAEARAEGFQSAQRINATGFDHSNDSRGALWDLRENRNWRVGTKASQIVADLGETSADFDMAPDLRLNVYRHWGSDMSSVVALTPGVNIKSYTYAEEAITATRAWVQGPDGFTKVIDTGAETGRQRREEFIEAGSSATMHQARMVARNALDTMARTRVSHTCQFYATPGCVPYRNFSPGDLIMGLDVRTGAARKVRVVSLSMARPDGPGYLLWTAELEEATSIDS